jgi:hypothetical protein
MQLNPYCPGWYHLAPCVNAHRLRDFEKAFHEAANFAMPQLFWDPLLRAASLGQLGKEKEAGLAAEDLLRLRPDFPDKASLLIGIFVKEPTLIDTLLDGLKRAGLKL